MPRVGVVGATGAVGTVTLELLAERGHDDVRAFASERSAGKRIAFGGEALVVEEATPEVLSAGDLDVCLFSVGTSRSLELVPHAVRGGAIAVDKSSAYRLADGVPLVVPEVNGARAAEHEGIVANPNCCTIPLTCVLKPLHDAAGLRRVRVATYQSMSGAGASNMQRLAATEPHELDLLMEWDFDGEEFDEETKLREETRSKPSRRSPQTTRAACWPPRPASGSRTSRRPARRRASTRSSSVGSGRTPPSPTGSSCSWPATTSARERR
jgi:aspartate-semialdehyde dehydrogenase